MGRGSGIKAVPCHSFRDKKTKKKKQKTHSLFLNKKIAIVAIQLNETRNVRTRDVPAIISTPGLSNNSRERANIIHEFSHPLQLIIRSAQKKTKYMYPSINGSGVILYASRDTRANGSRLIQTTVQGPVRIVHMNQPRSRETRRRKPKGYRGFPRYLPSVETG